MKQRMLTVESHMLRALGFVGHVEHPHKAVLSLLLMMEQPACLLQDAWNLANDRCDSLTRATAFLIEPSRLSVAALGSCVSFEGDASGWSTWVMLKCFNCRTLMTNSIRILTAGPPRDASAL